MRHRATTIARTLCGNRGLACAVCNTCGKEAGRGGRDGPPRPARHKMCFSLGHAARATAVVTVGGGQRSAARARPHLRSCPPFALTLLGESWWRGAVADTTGPQHLNPRIALLHPENAARIPTVFPNSALQACTCTTSAVHCRPVAPPCRPSCWPHALASHEVLMRRTIKLRQESSTPG